MSKDDGDDGIAIFKKGIVGLFREIHNKLRVRQSQFTSEPIKTAKYRFRATIGELDMDDTFCFIRMFQRGQQAIPIRLELIENKGCCFSCPNHVIINRHTGEITEFCFTSLDGVKTINSIFSDYLYHDTILVNMQLKILARLVKKKKINKCVAHGIVISICGARNISVIFLLDEYIFSN